MVAPGVRGEQLPVAPQDQREWSSGAPVRGSAVPEAAG